MTLLEQTIEARKKLQDAIDWNFGYVGNDKQANKCLEECSYLESRLKKEQPDEYDKYAARYYKD
jgi:hypothetical protein